MQECRRILQILTGAGALRLQITPWERLSQRQMLQVRNQMTDNNNNNNNSIIVNERANSTVKRPVITSRFGIYRQSSHRWHLC